MASVTVVLNLGLLLLLGWVWLRQYHLYGAKHTLGLLVVAVFLFVENGLWLYYYALDPDFIRWFVSSTANTQIGVTMLCGLELVALLALVGITWV